MKSAIPNPQSAIRNPRPVASFRTAALAVLALILLAPPVYAVVPSALGPLQALLAILPHLLVLLGAAAVAVFKPRTYRALFRYVWIHKVLTAMVLAIVGVCIWGGTLLGGDRDPGGAPWTAFHGGPDRSGAVPGAKGPL
ncbi:MAG: hypothetical protein NTW87_09140, partial [Planctomycetota bacterium]|nr:hypothetical protein [Planctomycetota bacterium]